MDDNPTSAPAPMAVDFHIRWSVGKKIGLLMLSVALLFAPGVVMTMTALVDLGREIHEMAKRDVPLYGLANDLKVAQDHQIHLAQEAIRVSASLSSPDRRDLEQFQTAFQVQSQEVNQLIETIRDLADRAIAEAQAADADEAQEAAEEYAPLLFSLGKYQQVQGYYQQSTQAGWTHGFNAPYKTELEQTESRIEQDLHLIVETIESFPAESAQEASGDIEQTIQMATVLFGIAMGVSAILAWLVIRRLVRSLRALTRFTQEVQEQFVNDQAVDQHVDINNSDEIGKLGTAFNAMIENLSSNIEQRKAADKRRQRLQAELLETSRLAGMSEMATGVLHNVGNVLNSVNVAANVLTEKVNKSRVASVAKTAVLINEHADDLAVFLCENEQGKQLPGYLTQLGDHLLSEQKTMLNELTELMDRVSHMREIVNTQQSYAKVGGVYERVDLKDLVEDALTINRAATERHQIQVIREFDEASPIVTIKHKIVQILVNFISNAKHAMQNVTDRQKTLIFRIKMVGGDRVHLEVADNGLGIDEEKLDKIFNYGFTTKKEGHGFGLHSGALAAKELGGRLRCHSDGPGKGAVFTLELPLDCKEAATTS